MKTKFQTFKKDIQSINKHNSQIKFALPSSNKMIPSNFEILGLPNKDGTAVTCNALPTSLPHEAIEVWFSQDRVFKMPRVIL
jgi:hypothetical protein